MSGVWNEGIRNVRHPRFPIYRWKENRTNYRLIKKCLYEHVRNSTEHYFQRLWQHLLNKMQYILFVLLKEL